MMIYSVIKRFKATGDSGRKEHMPRSDKKKTPRFLAGLKWMIKAKTKMSMMKLMKKKNVSRSTIMRVVKQDFGYKSYKL